MAASSCSDPKKKGELRISDNLDELTTDLAEYIAQLSEMSVKERGSFTIALSGGSLISLMGKLCGAPYDRTMDWTKWYVFWAEERAVGKNHVDSNYRLAKDEFLSKVSVLNSHIYSINDSLPVDMASDEYEFAIRQLVKARALAVSKSDDCPRFDLILLVMGPDGHIASLFPHHPALRELDEWVTYINDSPEAPPERITFTLPVINSAANVAIVATGEDKAATVYFAVEDNSEDFDVTSLPARMVDPTDGKLVWFMDDPAASQLSLGDDSSQPQPLDSSQKSH